MRRNGDWKIDIAEHRKKMLMSSFVTPVDRPLRRSVDQHDC
jgi:hypothetical protein